MGNSKQARGEMMSVEDIVRLASKVAAEAATDKAVKQTIETIRNEEKMAFKAAIDNRLHNTRVLLENYRAFKDVSEHAVFRAEECESLENIILGLMTQNLNDADVNSIKSSAARTAVIVEHIEKMLERYKNECFTNGTPEDEKRWRVIDGLYIQERKQGVYELADQEKVTIRQVYNYRESAISKIAVYMFGIDGIADQWEAMQ